MKIGIDIDNTITNIKEQLESAAIQYAKSLGKKPKNKSLTDTHNDGSIYQEIFHFTYQELKHFLGPIQEEITDHATPREFCVDIIKKLHHDGHEIYIITARDSEFHKNPYLQSKIWLNKNDVHYDKLIVNARNKSKVCFEEHIDLLIDDSLSNCLNVKEKGINAIRISEEQTSHGIVTLKNWKDIYQYINELNAKI